MTYSWHHCIHSIRTFPEMMKEKDLAKIRGKRKTNYNRLATSHRYKKERHFDQMKGERACLEESIRQLPACWRSKERRKF
ncbi:hypothetical protein [Ureibacillus sp. FSL K6-3587]|uniref:hypothetical protein n=1 Tax=unclassified Ureibacillus TaxID=2638520 RepID=UPI0031588959